MKETRLCPVTCFAMINALWVGHRVLGPIPYPTLWGGGGSEANKKVCVPVVYCVPTVGLKFPAS